MCVNPYSSPPPVPTLVSPVSIYSNADFRRNPILKTDPALTFILSCFICISQNAKQNNSAKYLL